MAAAYRVVVSSVSCYNSVVVDRRVHKHAVHYCAGPCGAVSQGLDCAVAHRGTCSELLVAPEHGPLDRNCSMHTYSHHITTATGTTYQVSAGHGNSLSVDTGGGLERAGSTGNMAMGEESPPWRVKKSPGGGGGSMGNLASATSLKDITGEAINLASGKLKEFSFDKLRLSASSHVTFRKGRKVRPDSFSRRSTDLDIIYGHFSSSVTTNGYAANASPVSGTAAAAAASNDENLPPFTAAKGPTVEEGKGKGAGSLSAVTKVGGGSTGSLSSACSGSLDQGLNTVASLYLNTLGEENLIARLLEKTRAEAGNGVGGEDIRACLDILLKCSEDLKKCTDIIKQCIRRKGPGGSGSDDEGANPESIYRAVMTRLSSYLKRLPLELEGIGGLGRLVGGQGGPGAPSSGHSELAELVNSLHSIQQGPFSPIFGHDQPPRYEDVVQSPPLPKSPSLPSSAPAPSSCSATYSSTSSSNSSSSSSSPSRAETVNAMQLQGSKPSQLTNGLQRSPHHHALPPPAFTHSASSPSSSPSHSPLPLYNHALPATPMEALFIEEDADVGKSGEQSSPQAYTPSRGAMERRSQSQIRNGTAYAKDTLPASPPRTLRSTLGTPSSGAGYKSSWDSTSPAVPKADPGTPYRNDDIDKLLLDLENLSQSMNHQREKEPPLPVKTRKMTGEGGVGKTASLAPPQPSAKLQSKAQTQTPANHHFTNGSNSKATQGQIPVPLPGESHGEGGGGGGEEDGALLLRILESIESFAQELVDSGAGSTGSSERSSGKEREVMRLLQDTLATAGRAETPPQSTQMSALASVPPVDLPESVPAVPPKHSHSNPPAASPAPVQHTPVQHTPVPHTPVQHTPVQHTPVQHTPVQRAPVQHTPVPHTPVTHTPVPQTTVPHTPAPSEPLFAAVPELLSLLLAQASTTTTTTTTTAPIPAPPPLPEAKHKVQAEESETPAAKTSAPSPGALPSPPVVLNTSTPDTAQPEALATVVEVTTVAGRDDDGPVGSPAAVRNTGSTLLIQQTPAVIRVQSKPEKKPGTPPPAPAAISPPPAPRSPSPPPAPRPPPPPAVVVVVDPAPVLLPPPPQSAIHIPRFYYPRGLPVSGPPQNHDAAIAAAEAAFTEFEEEKADIYEMAKIAKACGYPLYWKAPLFNAAGGERTGFVSVHSFIATWRKLLHSCHDDSSMFICLLAKPSCSYLEQEDFIPLMQDIVDTHPGLTFLKDAPEFHSRYITTVIQRIFYVVNRSWSGRVTMTELRRSNFLQTLALLEEEDDINQITDYFSYEHFYVIYCKFWELDTDHDLYIDPKDLARYNDHASSNRIIERMFSGAVTRGNSVQRENRMSYAEFVWFLISEEDKKNPTSIEYWFRCMDMDGDGVLSMFELEYFYEEQCERMEGMGIEPLPFQDLLCQMLDLVKPKSQGKITLSDLKRCRMAHIFLDTFFNLEKYLDHEQRDPFALQKDIDTEGPEPSDWDKYASEEYEILVAEETANEQLHDASFDDDYESDELQVPGDIGNKMEKLVISDLTA
ncbi:serine/threonine-protein phosphatase 2A regulatory subunit B'' subunit alpha isoform X1 [Gadus morhua]|uniref:serine/threonine-protein phosphatase 2A regulatory subunit B'' subunit alpha isoform X1 n=1 Tax=Gadus morhua TaxID=8049 RepID=UPI0011B406F2|nr:serine/threonine-protein phosphatase 2A regulatory subunit B'' subunit alpha isoform X1 [Gadus morhua]XP_030212044.1 serine/threonine-protein phosphatase 2A regulatory subunit B'' subunit alpha isoform X1 [Gadus morhua]XP_030212045.1 serine/threonine-protein phosphatase 2A regulatory subunit B'' subunit alpha isoform X1 [Gadus morhua]